MSWLEPWPDGVGHRWLDALAIPTLPWIAPVVDELGLPEGVAQRVDGFEPILRSASRLRDRLRHDTREGQSFEGTDGVITREVVINAMHQLADVYGSDTARAFERWARRHVVDPVGALWAWQLALTQLVTTKGQGAPDVLSRNVQTIGSEIDTGVVSTRIHQLAPEPSAEERSMGLDLPRMAGVVLEAIERERVLGCLQVIRSDANTIELATASQWAAETAGVLHVPQEISRGDELLSCLSGAPEEPPMEMALDLPIPRDPRRPG